MLDLQSGEYGEVRSLPQCLLLLLRSRPCWIFSPVSKAKSAVCRSVFFCVPGHARSSVRWVRRSPRSAAVSQPVPKASCGPPPDWAMSGVSSHRTWGQDCRMWLGDWGPVPHGHSSEWGFFSLWRWERSWKCPVLSLKTVTWGVLSSWWILSSSVPMSRRCRHSVLKLLLRMVFVSRVWLGPGTASLA